MTNCIFITQRIIDLLGKQDSLNTQPGQKVHDL